MQNVTIERTWKNGDTTSHHFAALPPDDPDADLWLEVNRPADGTDEGGFRQHLAGADGIMPFRFTTSFLRSLVAQPYAKITGGALPPLSEDGDHA